MVAPPPLAQVAKRLKATRAMLRARAMALSRVLLPVISLSVLQANAVTQAVSMQYGQALMEFLFWLRNQEVVVVSLKALDLALVRHFDELCMLLTPYSPGDKVPASLGHRTPHHAGSLSQTFPGASRSMRGWRRILPTRTRPPLPFLGMLLIAAQLPASGCREM